MPRGVVSRMSAAGSSGYPTNQPLLIDPDNDDNPTTGTETAGAYLYKWQHDNSGDEWHYPMNLPFELDWNAAENQPFFSVAPYSTGCRVIVQIMPVSPAWAQAVIAAKGYSQSGTLLQYDKYPVGANDFECKVSCDGETLTMATDNGSMILLWTADNDLHAAVYTDMYTTDDDSTLETNLAATNPGLWSTNDFYVSLQLT